MAVPWCMAGVEPGYGRYGCSAEPGRSDAERHAIYKHLSQKDVMPFPGEDKREFWQRAEERNRNTAVLYDKLGMAEYQAIEVFVRLF